MSTTFIQPNARIDSATSLIIMQDSVTPDAIIDPQAFAAYDDGRYSDFAVIRARFPKVPCKRIAISASDDGDVLDIENGDAEPSEAPGWFHRQIVRGLERPALYANASTMPAVIAAMSADGIPLAAYDRWVADYDGVANLDSVASLSPMAKQYNDQGFGRNVDLSVCLPEFFSESLPITHNDHYDWFQNGPFLIHKLRLDERSVVERYDTLRDKQHLNRAEQALLKATELHCRWLAQRLYAVAHKQPRKNGQPSWNLFHRGWRFRQLRLRGAGANPAA
jgi:hypothetical protein